MTVFALTEHMPRHEVDRYPKETSTLASLQANEAAYVKEALRLRAKYGSEIEIPLGLEGEWIRPESAALIASSIERHEYDFFIGSVHHVHTVPIDYDDGMYREARRIAGGTDERLFEDYFDAQWEMLKTLRPPVVGHFDLIRLKSDDPNVFLKKMPGVWKRVCRNLDFVQSYGGVLEINSAAVRKGMDDPYPQRAICEAAMDRGIRFCLSDDSHGIDQVVACYGRIGLFLDEVGIQSVTYLKHQPLKEVGEAQDVVDERFPTLSFESVGVEELKKSRFWGSPRVT